MEHVVHWGITFRSSQHYIWFLIVLGVAATLGIVYCVTLLLRGTRALAARETLATMWSWAGQAFASVSGTAILATKFGTENGPAYSVDCIWFNALVAVVFCTIAYLLRRKIVTTKKPL
jgi:hypothetical protein